MLRVNEEYVVERDLRLKIGKSTLQQVADEFSKKLSISCPSRRLFRCVDRLADLARFDKVEHS